MRDSVLLLRGDAVASGTFGRLEGLDGEAHLLAKGAADKAANAARGGGVEATKQWTNKLPLR